MPYIRTFSDLGFVSSDLTKTSISLALPPLLLSTGANPQHLSLSTADSTSLSPLSDSSNPVSLALPATGNHTVQTVVSFQDAQHYFSVLYTLCKVSGFKKIVKFLPHDVKDLEPCTYLLSVEREGIITAPADSGAANETARWHVSYGLLLWLGVLSVIPFDLSTVDSLLIPLLPSASSSLSRPPILQSDFLFYDHPIKKVALGGLVHRLLCIATRHLHMSSACREVAAVLVGRLFSRADMYRTDSSTKSSVNGYLELFIVWSREVLLGHITSKDDAIIECGAYVGGFQPPSSNSPSSPLSSPSTTSNSRSVQAPVTDKSASNRTTHVSGVLKALAEIVKTIPRECVRRIVVPLLWRVLRDVPLQALSSQDDSPFNDIRSSSTTLISTANSTSGAALWWRSRLCRKLWVKVIQRIGLAFLTPKLASWRYQRGSRSVSTNFSSSPSSTSSSASSSSSSSRAGSSTAGAGLSGHHMPSISSAQIHTRLAAYEAEKTRSVPLSLSSATTTAPLSHSLDAAGKDNVTVVPIVEQSLDAGCPEVGGDEKVDASAFEMMFQLRGSEHILPFDESQENIEAEREAMTDRDDDYHLDYWLVEEVRYFLSHLLNLRSFPNVYLYLRRIFHCFVLISALPLSSTGC